MLEAKGIAGGAAKKSSGRDWENGSKKGTRRTGGGAGAKGASPGYSPERKLLLAGFRLTKSLVLPGYRLMKIF